MRARLTLACVTAHSRMDSDEKRSAALGAWLVRLRSGAAAAQASTVAVVYYGVGIALPIVTLFAIVIASVVSNAVLAAWLRSRELSPRFAFGILALDIVTLTALLYFSGGPLNPFSVLYLVYVALAALVMSSRKTAALIALAAIGYGVLFFDHVPIQMIWRIAGTTLSAHLQGMWFAFVVAASFIAYFISRLADTLAERDEELALATERALRAERLASLATLAAGAAHELATPLATIQLVADDLLLKAATTPSLLDDAMLVREQVLRCRDVLRRLSHQAGEPMGEAMTRQFAADLANAACVHIGVDGARIRLQVRANPCVRAPRALVVESLGNLLRNALDCSEGHVDFVVDTERERVRFVVQDYGVGMTPDVAARIGEPFFTTKTVGKGMGLGVFVTRTLAEQLGGALTFSSVLREGTRAEWTLPISKSDEVVDARG